MTCRILVPWLGIEPTPVHCKYLNHWPTREVLYLYFFVKPRNGLHWGVINLLISSVQSLSCVQLFATPWTAAHQASLSTSTPRACSNSCPSSQWCHPTISFSVIPFSSCLQSFLASRSFLMSQFFASDGQSIGASTSASVLPMNSQDWFPLGLTGLISL